MTPFQLSDQHLRALFSTVNTIAVPGLSPKAHRPSYGVAQVMQQLGKRIIPINPIAAGQQQSILGEPAYASLTEAVDALSREHTSIDLVDVFRASDQVPALIDEVIALSLPAVWLQVGVIHKEAALKAMQAGVTIDMGRCLKVEWRRLMARP